MRRIIIGVVKALVLGGALILGCQGTDVEVVKLLPDPPLHTLSPKREVSTPTKQTKVVRTAPRPQGGYGWIPPGGISGRWECIVVHHSGTSGGSAREFHNAHLNRGWDELGYHFVIGNGTGSSDGEIEVGSRWYKQKHGAHCRTPGNYHNEHGIGICLVGNFERSYPSAKQMASLKKLVAFLMTKCQIPASRVIGHREAPGAHTKCPGRHLSTVQLRRALPGYVTASGY